MSNHEEARASLSSSSHQSSSRPSPRQQKRKELLNPVWLRDHSKKSKNVQTSLHSQDHISISDTSPRPLDLADDLGSIYRPEDAIETEWTNDLLYFFSRNEAGPSRTERGKGKDIRLFPGIRDYSNDPEPEGEDDFNFSKELTEGEIPSDEVLSVLPLNYAMEMPSPPNKPYRDPIVVALILKKTRRMTSGNHRTFFRAQASLPKSRLKRSCGW